ncbi:MAG: molybdopterin-dependent oxidoreductase [Alphaproteobacteria bacterium]
MAGRPTLSRRNFITLASGGAAGLALAGCDAWSTPTSSARSVLDQTNSFTEAVQRIFVSGQSLAREYTEADISPYFRANGSTDVASLEYKRLEAGGFADYLLPITGLVDAPLELSISDLRGMSARTQITRHDCVEGWSSIGKWTGPQLGPILLEAGVRPEARFVVFHCFDKLDQPRLGRINYYESIGMEDAFHSQTILAHGMNGATLPRRYGAPIRLRVERQLGYKMPKFIRAIEVVDSFAHIGEGRGGYYQDGDGYDWYAGI